MLSHRDHRQRICTVCFFFLFSFLPLPRNTRNPSAPLRYTVASYAYIVYSAYFYCTVSYTVICNKIGKNNIILIYSVINICTRHQQSCKVCIIIKRFRRGNAIAPRVVEIYSFRTWRLYEYYNNNKKCGLTIDPYQLYNIIIIQCLRYFRPMDYEKPNEKRTLLKYASRSYRRRSVMSLIARSGVSRVTCSHPI